MKINEATHQVGEDLAANETVEASETEVESLPANHSRSENGKRSRVRARLNMEQVMTCFAVCGRCSFFLAGYRALFGKELLETAVQQSKAGWLSLHWNYAMRELVHKTYGAQLEVNYYYYDSCCPECRRHFVYRAENGTQAPSFRIEIAPRSRK